jgi:RNA polymerase primary sigma factor
VTEALGRVKGRLGGLAWDIVQQRLGRENPKTLEEIGKRWGVSRERVRQVEKGTRQFLRRYLADLLAA